jgi:lysophospholipase L1-like esterase
MKKNILFFICLMIVPILVLSYGATTLAGDTLKPNRLASIGDSITVAMDAELPLENHYASWANGYYGFWQWLFGLTNVNSHNQRITAEFGSRGRKNYMFAESGAGSPDFTVQAQKACQKGATYVTVLLGNNDVCSDDLPMSTDDFETNMRAGLDVLEAGLPVGATVYVIGLPDISQLWDVIEFKKALGIVDCRTLWVLNPFDLFPSTCMGLLYNNPDGINYYITQYNIILAALVDEYNETGNKHYYYTDAVYVNGILEEEISDIDCYHPSAQGQKVLSEITWIPGPFHP